jgi:hypothetical protein
MDARQFSEGETTLLSRRKISDSQGTKLRKPSEYVRRLDAYRPADLNELHHLEAPLARLVLGNE